MRQSLEDLDGVFTYICVTEDALGVAKDELGAKPLVLYEDDDLVALASEEIAIRQVLDREIETHDPYEGEVRVWTQVSAEPTVRDGRARAGRARRLDPEDRRRSTASRAELDARELTTRKINAELRWLIYERGVRRRHRAQPERAALARRRDPRPLPDPLRGQPRLLRLRADRRAGGRDHRPGRLVGRREHDVRASSSSTTTPARSPAPPCAAATSSSRATSARAPGSTRRAARSSRSATPPR